MLVPEVEKYWNDSEPKGPPHWLCLGGKTRSAIRAQQKVSNFPLEKQSTNFCFGQANEMLEFHPSEEGEGLVHK